MQIEIDWKHAVLGAIVIAIILLIVLGTLLLLGYSITQIEIWPPKIIFIPPSTSIPQTTHSEPYASITAEHAIRNYYLLIQQKQYLAAWEMSKDYCVNRGLSYDEFVNEWEKSGPAYIIEPIKAEEENSKAYITISLNYNKVNTTHTLYYELIREPTKGSQRFDYWIFTTGSVIQ